MSRKRNKRKHQNQAQPQNSIVPSQESAIAFSFDDPEPVITEDKLYETVFFEQDEYFEPPISFNGLITVFRVNSYFESATFFKRNALVNTFIPSRVLSRKTFEALALDYLNLGNCNWEYVLNRIGGLHHLEHINARVMRRGKKKEVWFQLRDGSDPKEFPEGIIGHNFEYAPETDIYGLPEYIGALHSIWLSGEATLFRRKYYKNGAHMGYIFYANDPNMPQKDEETIKQALKDAKGPGNFRTLFYNNKSHNANEHAFRIVPIGEIATKDEFERIKNISNREAFIARRVPPELAAIIPDSNVHLGSPEKSSIVFGYNEINPLQKDFKDAINQHLNPSDYIDFEPYELPGSNK